MIECVCATPLLRTMSSTFHTVRFKNKHSVRARPPAPRCWGPMPHVGTFKVTAQVSLGALILASQDRPGTQIGAIAVRMIENAITVEFMEVSEITDHELT